MSDNQTGLYVNQNWLPLVQCWQIIEIAQLLGTQQAFVKCQKYFFIILVVLITNLNALS